LQRVCFCVDGEWILNESLKQSITEYISTTTSQLQHNAYDKIPLKFDGWDKAMFEKSAIRVVPGAIVRYGSFFENDVVLMNCFVNIGAYIGSTTMIDSFATIGSCAQIGKKCHISSNVVIGGVLEPVNALPVIIEDNCFIGANSSVVEGVLVRHGSTIAMGTHIGASTKIIDRETGQIFYKEIPCNAVVVPGTYQSNNGIAIHCAVIVRYGKTNTEINEKLRKQHDYYE
jgi:2,3,4,5-tetrahydropyridine-2-carboxylate N-succinyltransferase